jgi:hypothetical protein
VREGETLAAVYILGVIYRADMGFSNWSGLDLLTEAGSLQITISENSSIFRGKPLMYNRLHKLILRGG